ncbi:hypothetical protein L493_2102 [Bordetella bronchiseptica 99-R-0433]|nr:hypothetical protein L493_2102 [Bordetella bronchiseptica 99-R-0433]
MDGTKWVGMRWRGPAVERPGGFHPARAPTSALAVLDILSRDRLIFNNEQGLSA